MTKPRTIPVSLRQLGHPLVLHQRSTAVNGTMLVYTVWGSASSSPWPRARHILERVLLTCLPKYGSLLSGALGFVIKYNSANLYFSIIISFGKKKKIQKPEHIFIVSNGLKKILEPGKWIFIHNNAYWVLVPSKYKIRGSVFFSSSPKWLQMITMLIQPRWCCHFWMLDPVLDSVLHTSCLKALQVRNM